MSRGLWTSRPSAGITGLPITATVDDPDGGVTKQTWEWYTGDSGSGPWTRITGAGAAAYTPADTDIDKYLRVVAHYRDTLGTRQDRRGHHGTDRQVHRLH